MKRFNAVWGRLSAEKSHHWSFLPPANEVCEGYVFTLVCQSCCSQGGMCGRECVCGRGHAWQGACKGWGHAWQGGMCGQVGMCGRGCVWQGVCMPYTPPDTTRYGRSMGGQYASYWNAFLLIWILFSSSVVLPNFKKRLRHLRSFTTTIISLCN